VPCVPDLPGISLVGLSGAGKSAIGRLLAERLGRELCDTDQLIERAAGRSAAEILDHDGESRFRELEREALLRACASVGSVIATGGGALNDPLNRWALHRHGTLAWLQAPVEVLARRLQTDDAPRPLLRGDVSVRLTSLLAERAPFYGAADLLVDATRGPAEIADELANRALGAVSTGRLFDAEVQRHHPIGPETARVVLGTDLSSAVYDEILDREPVILADRRAALAAPELLAALPAGHRLEISAGERSKRLRRLEQVLEWMAERRIERGSPLVAFGGGTLGDLAGLAAALYARGLPLVQVPTTWLAQVDASIGGKVAVDLSAAKNMVGAFWPPVAVVSDLAALRTLTRSRLREGMAEAIKAGLIGAPELFGLIERRGVDALRGVEEVRYAITERAVRVKLAIVDRDPFEVGERRHLNLGHTIGHALEVASGYRLAHGAAVAIGLRSAATLAANRGGDPDLPARLDRLLGRLGYRLQVSVDAGQVRDAIGLDKKRERDRQRWILPMAVGQTVEVNDVTRAELTAALRVIGLR
jgi:shikimate kinase / 3-dehydroquinate synthase